MFGLGVLLPSVSSPLRRLLHVSTLILGTAIEMPHRRVGRLGLRTLPYQFIPAELAGRHAAVGNATVRCVVLVIKHEHGPIGIIA